MRILIDSSTSYRGRNSRPNWLVLLLLIGVALGAGALGFIFWPSVSPSSAVWYGSLAKPVWTPPNRWFGPVWTVLYLSMGTAVWLIWRERYHRARTGALVAYATQLLLNALWTPLFFGAGNIGAGLFLIVALWLSLVWTIREFAAVRAAAAWLLLPYLAWISVAVAFNLYVWRHNL